MRKASTIPAQPLVIATVTASCYCGSSTVAYRAGATHSEERAAINQAKAACPKCGAAR